MIVVDTHAVIWLTQEQDMLSAAALAVLIEGRRDGRLAIADITLREIAFQLARRRVAVNTSFEEYLRFIESLFRILPINGQIADRSTRFSPSFPRDPADRLIAATALVYDARLVTKNELIRASGEVNCVW